MTTVGGRDRLIGKRVPTPFCGDELGRLDQKGVLVASSKQQALDALLGRALRDSNFRQRLIERPAEVAKEANLSAEELELVAGGLAIGSSLGSPSRLMYCTEKTCNEKGGARVVMWSPDPAFSPTVNVQRGAEMAEGEQAQG